MVLICALAYPIYYLFRWAIAYFNIASLISCWGWQLGLSGMRDRFGIFSTVIRIRKLCLLLVMMLRIPNRHTLCLSFIWSSCSNPGKVCGKNTRRNIFTIIIICSIHKVMLQIIKSSCYDLISACFRTLSLSLGNHQFMSAKWFPLQCWPISRSTQRDLQYLL